MGNNMTYRMVIQSVLFSKKQWTTSKAKEYLKKHNLSNEYGVDITLHYLRYRQTQPTKKKKYYSKDMGNGIIYISQI